MNSPLVSVCITAYNHEPFIAQAIESVLNQKTSFDFEILIGEDNSSDKTYAICQDFQNRYPEKIKLVQHDRSNVIFINGRPTGRYNFLFNLKSAKGKYIALLDGDDYWIGSDKLEKQVSFLENHADFSFAFNGGKLHKENGVFDDFLNEGTLEQVDLNVLALGNMIRTHSVVFRNTFNGATPEILQQTPVADYVLHLLNATKGKGKFFKQQWGAYRIHSGGVWSNYKDLRMRLEWLQMLYQIRPLINTDAALGNFEKQANQTFVVLVNMLIAEGQVGDVSLKLKEHLDHFPNFRFELISHQTKTPGKQKGIFKRFFQ